MYAIVQTGGKQCRMAQGQVIRLEKLDANEGDKVNLEQVLFIADNDKIQMGTPYVAGAKVVVEVLSHGRGKKIRVVKFKRRQNYRRTQGHRQWYTEVKIQSIEA
jgi:large subunit ribosomal protein L21